MPRPKIDPEKRRTERFETLLTEAEAEALGLAREDAPVSEYIRDVLRWWLRPWLKR